MKYLFTILIFSTLLLASPPLPNHVGVYFNKKGISLNIKKLQELANKEDIQTDFFKDKNISGVIFKNGDFAYSKEGKAITIDAKKVKSILQKAYEQKVLKIDKKDLQEIKANIAPAKNIFFLPKWCSINKMGISQVTYKGKFFYEIENNQLSSSIKYKNIPSNHWYAIPNGDRLKFINNCPKIVVLR